ncbi:MAG TPA: ATP synthase F1 subunit delta [Ferruginibacter sp.]|nr:ATP synthase F1 subunit delta [Ferruginibacter sp.]
MNNPRLAGRYAKSIVDLSIEQNQLEAVYEDMKFIKTICKSNPDFVAVLRSPIIKGDVKGKIIGSITKERVSKLTSAFITLLIVKGREYDLPEIADAFIDQYNEIKNIHKVKITTAVPVDAAFTNAIVAKLKTAADIKNVEIETAVNEELIGGFILETGGKLIDASVLKDLNELKREFSNNEYIHNIR